jgi:peptidoglycan/LPS O-acetylase OafA/YrhL
MINPAKEDIFAWGSVGAVDVGNWAVNGFFALSGFLIVQSFLQTRGIGNYLLKRVLRIYPAFICAGILSLVLFGPIGARFSAEYWNYFDPGKFFGRLATLQPYWLPHWFKDEANRFTHINSPPWTIQYEFICYLLVIVIGLCGMLRFRILTLAFFVGAAVLDILNEHKIINLPYEEYYIFNQVYNYPRFFTYFLAGACCYLYRDVLVFKLRIGLPIFAGMVIFAAVAKWQFGPKTNYVEFLLPVVLPYFLFAAAFSRHLPLNNWAKYGDFSYGLYLYGWPVQQVIIMWSGGKIPPLGVFAIATVVTLAIAVGSWYAIERPFLRLKPKKKPAKIEPPLAPPLEVGALSDLK